MSRTLIRNADVVVTMDDQRRELAGGFVVFNAGVIEAIGASAEIGGWADKADDVVDAAGCLITPGLVNTHHHLFQTLTRAVSAAQSAPLFDWLKTLYPIWAQMRADDFVLAAKIGLAELALSGCTQSSDHQYIYPDGVRLDDTIEAALSIGIRFHATRGAMSIGESSGGLPPDSLVEAEPAILDDCIRVIDRFHDPRDGAMTRVAVAPCSPFSVSRELMRDAALLARDKHVMLHTHLAEDDDDIAFSLARFNCRPGQYAEELNWVGDDVWHAHCVKLDAREIALFAKTRTGIAHCPSSNCRLGSGVAPIKNMISAGVKIGLGVDGSASNDSAHLLSEARQAMLLQRVALGADAMNPREALELATRGGANVLGRPDCGVLAAGRRADIAIWDINTLSAAGAWDPVAALVLCGPHTVKHLFVEGRQIVSNGAVTTIDHGAILHSARASVRRMLTA